MAQMASESQRIVGQVTAMAMLDDAFKARLEASPIEVLQEFGMDVPGTADVKVVTDASALSMDESADSIQLFVPNVSELSEDELSMVTGAVASCQSTASTFCTFPCLSTASTASTNSCS